MEEEENLVIEAEFSLNVSNVDHSLLINRNLPNQHSIDSITDLGESLDAKQNKLTEENAGDNITITEEDGIVKINGKASGGGEVDGGTANSVYIEELQELDGGNAEEP